MKIAYWRWKAWFELTMASSDVEELLYRLYSRAHDARGVLDRRAEAALDRLEQEFLAEDPPGPGVKGR